jgi:hypothetical protein
MYIGQRNALLTAVAVTLYKTVSGLANMLRRNGTNKVKMLVEQR